MARFLSHILIRLSLVLAIAAGLVGAGFAHRAVAPIDADLLAFLEVGGTIEDLCDDGSPITHWGNTGCEACRLTDTANVPTPQDAPLAFDKASIATLSWTAHRPPATDASIRVHPARAPPVV